MVNLKLVAHTKADELFLQRVDDIIQSHIADEKLDVDMIAAKMNLSRPTLYRKINEISAMTPNEWIKITRLRKAAELILQGDLKIYEIAEAVGFNSQSYFSCTFAKHFHMSPTQYAKSNNVQLWWKDRMARRSCFWFVRHPVLHEYQIITNLHYSE